MKANEALIAHTPAAWTDPKQRWGATAGQVKVGPLIRQGEPDWTQPFAMTTGAASVAMRKATGSDALARLLLDFHTMVVRDGIDPQAAHAAFLAIEEYRESISPDIPGASEG